MTTLFPETQLTLQVLAYCGYGRGSQLHLSKVRFQLPLNFEVLYINTFLMPAWMTESYTCKQFPWLRIEWYEINVKFGYLGSCKNTSILLIVKYYLSGRSRRPYLVFVLIPVSTAITACAASAGWLPARILGERIQRTVNNVWTACTQPFLFLAFMSRLEVYKNQSGQISGST